MDLGSYKELFAEIKKYVTLQVDYTKYTVTEKMVGFVVGNGNGIDSRSVGFWRFVLFVDSSRRLSCRGVELPMGRPCYCCRHICIAACVGGDYAQTDDC